MEELQYPIGRFKLPSVIDKAQVKKWIDVIEHFPNQLRTETNHLSEEQLNTSYRPGGWTVRQLVNHCADSHMNAFIRFKLALTEENPLITAYKQDDWANLTDSKVMPIDASLKIIEGLHARWTLLLHGFSAADLKRTYIHPEKGREVKLEEALANYAWHCEHHLAHITSLKSRMAWY